MGIATVGVHGCACGVLELKNPAAIEWLTGP